MAEVNEPLEIVSQDNSVTIRGYYKGYSVLTTQRNGDETIKPLLQVAMIAIDWMTKTEGWKASWDTPQGVKTQPNASSNATAQSVPTCPIHNKAMTWKTGVSKTTNKPYAFWSCATKNPDETWCNYKPDMNLKKGVQVNAEEGEPIPF